MVSRRSYVRLDPMNRYLQAMGIDQWTLRPMASLYDQCVLYVSNNVQLLTKLPNEKQAVLLNNILKAFGLTMSQKVENEQIEVIMGRGKPDKFVVLGYDLAKQVASDVVGPDLQKLLEHPQHKAVLWQDWQAIQ